GRGGSGGGTGGSGGRGGAGGAGGAGGGGGLRGGPPRPIIRMPPAAVDTPTRRVVVRGHHDPDQPHPPAGTEKTSPSLDTALGSPTPGSLQIAAPFSAPSQSVTVETAGTGALQDWSGQRTLHARIRTAQGPFGVAAQLFVKTGPNYLFGAGRYVGLPQMP